MELKQRKLVSSNKFLIRDHGIEWTYKEKLNFQNTFFEFEELNFKKSTIQRKYSLAFVIISVLSFIGLMFSVFPTEEGGGFGESTILMFLPLTIIFALLTYFSRIDNLYIPTERGISIIMYNKLPNEKDFSDFLKLLKSEAKKSMMEKYFDDEGIDKKKLYNFMEERGLLDKNEKQEYRINLKNHEIYSLKGFCKN